MNNLVNKLISIEELENKDILELGAGTGRLTFKLYNTAKSILAFDISKEMLKTAKRIKKKNNINNVEFRQANSLYLPELNKEYDKAIQGWSFLAVIAFSKKKMGRE